MDVQRAKEIVGQIHQLQSLMIAFVTGTRSPEQPAQYRDLFSSVHLALEAAKYTHPNPHKSLETFWAFCKLQGMTTYASRRAYVEELYADILLELKRIQSKQANSKLWAKANEVLEDELAPVRVQWLKAKNFIFSSAPDFENSIKESISAIESCLMILLNEPKGTLGKLVKGVGLDPDIERLLGQVYGFASNRDFVRHGGVTPSTFKKEEAEFFLEFAASAIVYITAKLKHAKSAV